MNKVILCGRLTADPELRSTSTGMSVCDFTVAVDKVVNGQKEADFIICKVWGKQADNLCKYKVKGDLIGVVGSWRVEKYQDKNGNDRIKNYCSVVEVEFLGKGKKDEPQDDPTDYPF